ncbi:hypothetical protein QQP08_012036 [Theobroma cacao]|nr:hypothetical protein QQP08_012036 [Theobroma cacao]
MTSLLEGPIAPCFRQSGPMVVNIFYSGVSLKEGPLDRNCMPRFVRYFLNSVSGTKLAYFIVVKGDDGIDQDNFLVHDRHSAGGTGMLIAKHYEETYRKPKERGDDD